MRKVEIIVPVFNEYEVIDELIKKLNEIKSQEYKNTTISITIVDDGSSNEFVTKLKQLKENNEFKLIELAKNSGQQIALRAGLNHSSSDAIIFMDADLQDPPDLISIMIDSWHEGFDVVHTVRTKREKESLLKKITANLFYKIANKHSDYELTKNSGDFKLIDKKIVKKIKENTDGELYLRGAIDFYSTKPDFINYERKPRFAGHRKYKYSQSFNLAMSGLVSFSNFLPNFLMRSLYVFGLFFGVVFIYFINSLQNFDYLERGWASIIGLLLFTNFVQLVSFLFIGVYLKKIFNQTSGRDMYFIKEITEE